MFSEIILVVVVWRVLWILGEDDRSHRKLMSEINAEYYKMCKQEAKEEKARREAEVEAAWEIMSKLEHIKYGRSD